MFCPLEVRFSHLICFKGGLTEKAQKDLVRTVQWLFQGVGVMDPLH